MHYIRVNGNWALRNDNKLIANSWQITIFILLANAIYLQLFVQKVCAVQYHFRVPRLHRFCYKRKERREPFDNVRERETF